LAEIAAHSIYIPDVRNVGEVGARGRGKEKRREEKKGEFRSEDSVVTCVP
jgi:hypothetical protein